MHDLLAEQSRERDAVQEESEMSHDFDHTLRTPAVNDRTGWIRWNGSIQCDMDDGPCSCGAWHFVTEERVKRWPIYRSTFNTTEEHHGQLSVFDS